MSTATDSYSVDAYRAAGVPDLDIAAWQDAGILAPRARGFRSHDVTVAEAVALREIGIVSVCSHRFPVALVDLRRASETTGLIAADYRASTVTHANVWDRGAA